jgi:nucleotide-binding universal stress UspA family protein
MISKILVGVDGSDPSIYALNYAAELAINNKSDLILLSVVPEIPILAGSRGLSERMPELQNELESERKRMLESHEKRISEDSPGINITSMIKNGSASKAIVDVSREMDVDLIVVGNRGTGGIATWMLGSISRDVVERCTVPVLVIKNQKYCKL